MKPAFFKNIRASRNAPHHPGPNLASTALVTRS